MRKLGVLAVAALVVVSAYGTGLAAPAMVASATSPSASAPKLVCKIKSIKLVGTSVVASGGCTLGNRPVDARQLKWTWSSKAADLSGSRCDNFGVGKGTGKRIPLPKKPASVTSAWRGGLPGRFDVQFTVSAKVGKQSVKASGSKHWQTPRSYVYCGVPPKLISQDGVQPSALVWDTPPTFDGTVFRPGTIRSVGNGGCRWVKGQPLADGAFLTIGWQIVCDNATEAYVSFVIWFYGADQQRKCVSGLNRTSSFVIFPQWGPGSVYVDVDIVTWIKGVQGVRTNWRKLVYLTGTEDPCADFPAGARGASA